LVCSLSPVRPKPKGGRQPVPDRAALTGIIFVLKTDIHWEDLPAEMGCGLGMTCWRRLRDWQAAGVWARLHRVLLERLHGADKLNWSRASLDRMSVPAKGGIGSRPESDGSRQAGRQAAAAARTSLGKSG